MARTFNPFPALQFPIRGLRPSLALRSLIRGIWRPFPVLRSLIRGLHLFPALRSLIRGLRPKAASRGFAAAPGGNPGGC